MFSRENNFIPMTSIFIHRGACEKVQFQIIYLPIILMTSITQ